MRIGALWLCFWIGQAALVHAETRVALVVGNSHYRNAVGELPNPLRDSQAMAATLREDGFEVAQIEDADRAALLGALRTFSQKADGADWALFYYAGHGMEVGGVNYLLPIDVTLKTDLEAQDEAVSLDRVLETVGKANRMRIVVLDACRNNPFAETMKRTDRTRSVSRGLAPVKERAGMLVAYAADANQTADDGDGEHSPFTAALLGRLRQPGLEVSALFNRVTADVMDATKDRQRPVQYGSIPSSEDLYFRPPATRAEDKTLESVWSYLQMSADANALKAFESKLPQDSDLRKRVEARLAQIGGDGPQGANAPIEGGSHGGPTEVALAEALSPSDAFGLTLSTITNDARQTFKIKNLKGVLISAVKPNSAAAANGFKAGDVIEEISQQPVSSTAEVLSALSALKKQGRKSALLLVGNGEGGIRFSVLRLY